MTKLPPPSVTRRPDRFELARGGQPLPPPAVNLRKSRPMTDRTKRMPQAERRCALVRAALRAAAARPAAPFVMAALRAAAERSDAGRRDAARLACLESDLREAVSLGSGLRTWDAARDTRGRRRVLRLCCPAAQAYSALLRVLSLVGPLLGGERPTPARRAFERPIAMACCGDLAPCTPRRTLWISSRTNSPACVVGAFPARLSLLAFSMVRLPGDRKSVV